MVNLCALVAIGGQHLSFFVGVLDGDYFLLLLLFEGPNDDSYYFCCCRVRSGAVTAISEGVSVFLVPS